MSKLNTYGLAKLISDSENKSYLDYFVPLVVEVLSQHNISRIEINKLHDFIKLFEEFHNICVPFQPMQLIINKCTKEYKIFNKIGTTLITNWEESNKFDISSKLSVFVHEKNVFIRNFKNYAKEKYNFIIDENVETMILNFVGNFESEILFYQYDYVECPINNFELINSSFILIDYIKYAHVNMKSDYDFIINIVYGQVIANAILVSDEELQSLNLYQKNVYFDTPIVLRILGYSEPEFVETYRKFLESIQDSGGEVLIFKHTFEEIEELLSSALPWLDGKNYSSYDPTKASLTTQYLIQTNYSGLKLEIDILKLQLRIEELGIRIEEKPIISDKNISYNIDENYLINTINSLIKSKNRFYDADLYKKRTQRDVDSISSIYLLRDGNNQSLAKAKHFFITTNSSLALANRMYCNHFDYKHTDSLACLTDTFFGTLIWLNNPKLLIDSISIKFLGQCTSMLRADQKTESKLRSLSNELLSAGVISENDYILLVTTALTKFHLNERILGDNEQLSSKTLLEILDDIKAEIIEPVYNDLKKTEKENSELKNYLEKSESIIKRNESTEIDLLKQIDEINTGRQLETAAIKVKIEERINVKLKNKLKKAKFSLFIIFFVVNTAVFFNSDSMLLCILTLLISGFLTFYYSEKKIEDYLRKKLCKEYEDIV